MDTEDEPTQLCTQPWAPEKQVVDDTTGVLCVLFPTSFSAKQTVLRMYRENRDFVFVQNGVRESDTITSYNQTRTLPTDTVSIALRFDPGPKVPEDGFCFGRNQSRCDAILGDASNSRRISNVHFRIFVNEHDTLMLTDSSVNGTYVDGVFLGPPNHNNHGTLPMDQRPRSRQLVTGSEIRFLKGVQAEEMRFLVRIPKSNGCGFQGDGDADFYGYESGDVFQQAPVAGPVAFRRDLEHVLQKRADKNGEEVNPAKKVQRHIPNNNDPKAWVGSNAYMLLDSIGQGAFATVQKGIRRKDGAEVAIKIINRRTFSTVKGKVIGARKEVDILQGLKHANIVEYFECLEDDSHIYIIMEFISGGDLGGYIHKHGRMDEPLAQEVTRQILLGIRYIHRIGITHRDIKPDNILLASEEPMVIKISDFGLAKMVGNEDTFLKTFCGTMLYLAPEVFPSYHFATLEAGSKRKHDAIDGKAGKQQKRYNQAVDMWSIGCVTYVLLTGRPPFEAKTQEEIYRRIWSGKYDVEALRSSGINNRNCDDFLSKLLTVNPAQRMVEYAALRHPWLTEHDREDDSSFSSSMEVDMPNTAIYMPGDSQMYEQGGNGGSEDEREGRTVRHKREEYADYEDDFDDITPQGTMIKKNSSSIIKGEVGHQNNVKVQDEEGEEEFSFDYPATQSTGEVLRTDPLALSVAGDQEVPQSSSGVLGLEAYEFVSERGIQPGSDEDVQIPASQFGPRSPYPASQHRNSQARNTQQRYSQQRDFHQRRVDEDDDVTPVGSQIVPSSPLPPPRPNRAVPAPAPVDTSVFGSSELNATRVLMSPAESISGLRRLEATVSQKQMPPPVAPPPPSYQTAVKNGQTLVPKCSQEDLLDFDNALDVTPPYWGKLVALPGALPHPNVMLRGNNIIFGRVKPCSVVYTDDRLSKKHCAFASGGTAPSKGLRGSRSNAKPTAWLKCTATNACWLNGQKVTKDAPTALKDGDEIILFKDTLRNEVFGFNIHLTPAKSASGSSDDDATEFGGSGEDCGRDGDQEMGELN